MQSFAHSRPSPVPLRRRSVPIVCSCHENFTSSSRRPATCSTGLGVRLPRAAVAAAAVQIIRSNIRGGQTDPDAIASATVAELRFRVGADAEVRRGEAPPSLTAALRAPYGHTTLTSTSRSSSGISSTVPLLISDPLSGVDSITVGNMHTCLLTSTGAGRCFGASRVTLLGYSMECRAACRRAAISRAATGGR